ncbi:MAG: hypothetical protein JXQ99_23220 [Hyphomicrobiaceae bacterium]
MTAVSHCRADRVICVAVLLLGALLCVPASFAASNDHRGAHDGSRVTRLSFTGTYRFRPASISVQRKRSTTSVGTSKTIEDAAAPVRSTSSPVQAPRIPVQRPSAKPGPASTDVARRPTPPLSRATRSGLGVAPGRDIKHPRSKTQTKPPLPARYKRRITRKNKRKTRTTARVTKPKLKPTATKKPVPQPPSIFDEPPAWAKDTLFNPN